MIGWIGCNPRILKGMNFNEFGWNGFNSHILKGCVYLMFCMMEITFYLITKLL